MGLNVVGASLLLSFLAAAMLMALETAGASPDGPTLRGRTILQVTPDRGIIPACTRNVTRCLDPRFTPTGPTCCNDRCVNTRNDTNHCGRCNRVCGFLQGCCGSRCVNLQSDPQNCGRCGIVCNEDCVLGLCAYSGF